MATLPHLHIGDIVLRIYTNMADKVTNQKHFVDQHKEELIYGVSNVEGVLSQLLQDKLLISEEYEAVRTKRNRPDRMRKLFSVTQDWCTSKKEKLYQALKSNDPAAVCDMERSLGEGSDEEVEEYMETYREKVKHHFELLKDRNSRLGESFALRRRYTKLVLLGKFRGEEERKRELSSSGEEHLQILMDRSSGEYSPTSIEELFDPDNNGLVPKAVVLHGPTGIGKSLTAHKISYDWAVADLYKDKFSYLFYISYKEFAKITGKISLAGLVSKTCKLNFPAEVMKDILSQGDQLGFVINGFDEVKWTLKDEKDVCEDPCRETHKEVLLRSLLKGRLVKGASLVITTRSFGLEKLQTLLPDPPRLVEIVGYTGEARDRYICTYFERKEPGEKAVAIIKKKEAMYTMCSVPFMCWVVSTVTRQQISKYPSNFTTDTSMFLYYFKGLLIYHCRNDLVIPSLKKICALANEGVLSRKVLFEEEDLRRHKISISWMESVFLYGNVFQGDIGKRTCYSFIHRIVQDLLAVVYYALPVEGEKKTSSGQRAVRESTYLPEICKGRSLKDLLEKDPHLALAVRFLFGLVNQTQNKDFTKSCGCSLSFQATTAMIEWLFGGEISDFDTEHLYLLYETRDDDFMQSVVSRAVDLNFSQCQEPDDWVYQLAFCLKACAGRKVTLSGYVLDREHLLVLVPLLKKCPQVW
ncbi:PREDICTED: NACHT, LRR and PYD domains-containing protein 3-like [Nanorana parkeri]|uniref:NACHT, LRR and PYD domains-containing protein 3-like n=1 Tax=Nanorana parkeri TaxID=125878 RepID=UPI0008547DED|nr:PREDICTED: NACHT, LRR and PYD domains-containing protein 3-like [Nanorana parkeri]